MPKNHQEQPASQALIHPKNSQYNPDAANNQQARANALTGTSRLVI